MANLSSKTGTVTTPVQAQISLANNSTTSVQDMSAYQAQEVTGFVYVDATADLRCSFKVMVVKNGADVFEIAAVDLAGDDYSGAPLLSFSMSGSVLRVTLPNITGFNAATSYLRYQLSAPYLGGNYPLSVSASQVLGNAAGTAVPAGYIGQELVISTNWSGTSLTSNTDFQFNNVTSSTLPAGVWLCQIIAQCAGTAAGTVNVEVVVYAGSTVAGGTGITQATNTNVPGGSGRDTAVRSSLFYYNSAGLTGNVSGTGQFSLQLRSNGATNTLYAASTVGQLRAIRIA